MPDPTRAAADGTPTIGAPRGQIPLAERADGSTPTRRGKPLRVAMICPYSLTIPGGVQAQVMGLARALRKMGIEVRVLAPCDGPPPATFVTPLGNSLPTAANGSIAPLAPDPACQLRTIRALTDEQFDVLHLHEPYVPGPTMTATVMATAPIVATFHAAGDSASYRYLKHGVNAFRENVVVRVAVSKDAAELTARYLGGEYEVLFNGVELDEFRDADAWPTSGPTIFFCGRHEERKGLRVLLQAIAGLPAEVTLWVAGSGPDTAALRAEFGDDARVQWLGRITDDEKYSRMKSATVFCAPSLHGESFGVVLLEAMAAGTAVVASSLDGYRNVATNDVDSILVEPGDVDLLAAALRTVLDDPALAGRLEAAGATRAEQFAMRTLAGHYAEHYRRVADDPRNRAAVTWPFTSSSESLRRRVARRMMALTRRLR